MITRGWLQCRWLACLLLAPGLVLASPLAYIPNGVSGTVSVIDTGTNTVTITIPVGLGAAGVAVNATGTRVYVTNIVFNFVSVIDTTTDTVVGTVNVGNSPGGIAVNPAGTRVYVSNGDDNTVSVIDTATNAVITTVAVGAYPGGLVVDPAGTRIYVANNDAGSVSVIDAGTNKVVATVTVGAPLEMIAVSPSGTRLYVTTDLNTVSVIDTATAHTIGSVAVGGAPLGIAVNPAGTRVYVANNGGNNVSIIDTASNAVVATVAVGAGPAGIAVNPGGTRAYVANYDSNSVSAIDTTSNTVIATIAVGISPVAVGQFIGPDTAAASNYQGLWWKSDEPYWGVNFAHQGDLVFATWYTYDTAGNAYWLSMLGTRASATSNAYGGDINVDIGPPFNNFVGIGSPGKVGTGTVTFTDANNGTFAYQLSAGGASNIDQSKPITRFSLGGAQPTCTYSTTPNLAGATNYQDLWWVPTESGWGINFAHQGNLLFATWYTYDAKVAGNNAPLWLSALLTQGTGNVFSGPITRTSGPRFDNYKASDVVQPIPTVGSATLTFSDGNHASFHYVTNGAGGLPAADQTKAITRFLFSANGATICQ